MKYAVIFIALLTISFSILPENVKLEFGSYSLKGAVWSSETLDIYADSTFVAHSSGCTYSYDGKGKWSLRNDTLIAIATQSRNERFDTVYKACEPQTFLYLVREKSFILLEENTTDTLYKSEVLGKKGRSAKREVRQRF